MNTSISPAVMEAAQKEILNDPIIKKINELTEQIKKKKNEIIHLEAELSVIQKTRPEISIKWRESIFWCLNIDAQNPEYFLKSAAGVYKCIAYKHKIEVTSDIKSKIGTSLSMLFQQKKIGRLMLNGISHYGLLEFFDNDLVTLKKKYEKDLKKLIL